MKKVIIEMEVLDSTDINELYKAINYLIGWSSSESLEDASVIEVHESNEA